MRRRRTSGWSATGRWTKMAPRISATWGGAAHHRHGLGPRGPLPSPTAHPSSGTPAHWMTGRSSHQLVFWPLPGFYQGFCVGGSMLGAGAGEPRASSPLATC